MPVTYEFEVGDRVYCDQTGQNGTVESMVPGDGRNPWYYVHQDNGDRDRFQSQDLTPL